MHKADSIGGNDQRHIILNGCTLVTGIDHHPDLPAAGLNRQGLNIVCNPIQMCDFIMYRFVFPDFGRSNYGLSLINKDRKSTRLNSSHVASSYAVFCSKKK